MVKWDTHNVSRSEGDLMNETIKRIALSAVDSTNPVQVLFGTVTKTNPIEITVHQKLLLTRDFLVHLQRDGSALVQGDTVLLVRVQGGQKFVVMDKVVG